MILRKHAAMLTFRVSFQHSTSKRNKTVNGCEVSIEASSTRSHAYQVHNGTGKCIVSQLTIKRVVQLATVH